MHYDSDLGFHCLCSWFLPLLSQLSHITIIHSPFRRGLAAVGRLGLPHTLSSPLGGGGERVWLLHPSTNALPSSPPLSSLLISYPLFSHAIPQPHLSSFTHTSTPPLYTSHKNAFLKSQIFYKKLASGRTTQVKMLLAGMGADLPCDSDMVSIGVAHGSPTSITHHHHPLPSSGGGWQLWGG